MNDPDVDNAIKVMMSNLSTSSFDSTGKVYANWPEYCRQNAHFLSSFGHQSVTGHGILPDIIMPGPVSHDTHLLDLYTSTHLGKDYLQ